MILQQKLAPVEFLSSDFRWWIKKKKSVYRITVFVYFLGLKCPSPFSLLARLKLTPHRIEKGSCSGQVTTQTSACWLQLHAHCVSSCYTCAVSHVVKSRLQESTRYREWSRRDVYRWNWPKHTKTEKDSKKPLCTKGVVPHPTHVGLNASKHAPRGFLADRVWMYLLLDTCKCQYDIVDL